MGKLSAAVIAALLVAAAILVIMAIFYQATDGQRQDPRYIITVDSMVLTCYDYEILTAENATAKTVTLYYCSDTSLDSISITNYELLIVSPLTD